MSGRSEPRNSTDVPRFLRGGPPGSAFGLQSGTGQNQNKGGISGGRPRGYQLGLMEQKQACEKLPGSAVRFAASDEGFQVYPPR